MRWTNRLRLLSIGVCVTACFCLIADAQNSGLPKLSKEDRYGYARHLIETFTSGKIIELSEIPDTEVFSRFLKSEGQHEDITEAELREKMLKQGIMHYLIRLLGEGQLSLTEYVNLRPDIHWVEALRMAYVGGGLEMSSDFKATLMGEVSPEVEKLRKGKDIVVKPISYSSSVEDISPIYAEVAYDPAGKKMPIYVMVHGDIPGTRLDYVPAAYGFAKKGLFVIVPSLRGRDGSAGKGDLFAKEIYDIYDAVEYVKKNYAAYVDPTNIAITGASAGGMSSFAAVVRFPDYFRYAMPNVGSPNSGEMLRDMGMYGKTFDQFRTWAKQSGVPEGGFALYANIIDELGGMPDDLPDKIMVRNNVLGAVNNPYTQIHAFWDEQDGAAPGITTQSRAYLDAVQQLGYENVHLHYSQRGDPVRYLHWVTPDRTKIQYFYIPQILAGTNPPPVLADAGRMVVLGYLKTKRFMVWLGSGDDAVARLDYELSPFDEEFSFRRLSHNTAVRGKLHFPNDDGVAWRIEVNHQVVRRDVRDRDIVVDFGLDDTVALKRD